MGARRSFQSSLIKVGLIVESSSDGGRSLWANSEARSPAPGNRIRPENTQICLEIVGAPAVELVTNEKVLKLVGFILAGQRFDWGAARRGIFREPAGWLATNA
ncbi:ATPase PAAT [Trichinella spiralis]|uniref:Uncharacterized protein n=2 Tax=Trichinella spiralis TaxID=6334 RepID=A0A0V1AWC8_TRISP|nr:hypothetical protein T01_11014 [Trichinella spiralis]